jgi:hypothetical protein
MPEWIHATQKVEIATMCRPPRSRAAKIVREVVEIPYRIRVLEDAHAPVALRLDQDAMKSEMKYQYGVHGLSILNNLAKAGKVAKTGKVEMRSSPEGFLCMGSGSVAEYVENDLWEKLPPAALAMIEKQQAPFTGAGYSGPEGAVDVEWSTYDAAMRTVQRIVDDMFVCDGTLFCPANTPFLVQECEKQAHGQQWVWGVRNSPLALKTENAYHSLADAARELEDFSSCVEIVDERLIPGIAPTIVLSVMQSLSNPSYGEVILAGEILKAAGQAQPWATPVDWEALDAATREMRNLRNQFKIPNETTRIVLDLPEEARRPAPGTDHVLDDEPEAVFQL